MSFKPLLLSLLIFFSQSQVEAKLGKAPEFPVLKWYDSSEKEISAVHLEKYKGKVVYLHFFQSWCPGCLKDGLPTIKKLSEFYKKNEKVKFFAVQTVFEGFSINTKAKLKKIRKQFDLNFPMAQDDGGGKGSLLMKSFKTRGTPWAIIIDPKGNIAYSNFHIEPNKAIMMIDELLWKNKKNDSKK